MDYSVDGKQLVSLGKINVLLGKNGCGKSTLLRKIDEHLSSTNRGAVVKYVTPERGGDLTYDASFDQNSRNNLGWMVQTLRRNRTNYYRAKVLVEYRKLENNFLR